MASPGDLQDVSGKSWAASRPRRAAAWLSVLVVAALAVSAMSAPVVRGADSHPRTTATFSTLRVASLQEPDSLNPNVGVLSASYVIWAHTYELLVGIGPDLTPVPSLAESWEVTPDGLVWTFHLQQDASWHDDVPFTAEDVNFTFRYLAPAVPGNPIGCDLTLLGSYLGDATQGIGVDVANITVLDDYTIRIPTFQPKANILSMFIQILPKHLWSTIACNRVGHLSDPPKIGTGMYKFITWSRGAYIQLDLFDKYWRLTPGQDYVDRIVVSYYTDPTSVFNAFAAGSIDATAALNAAQFNLMPTSVAGGTDNVQKYAVDAIGFSEMGACVASDQLISDWGKRGGRHWLVTNRTIRQAVQFATDRSFLVDNVKEGRASPGSTIIPPATPFWHYSVTEDEEFTFDFDRARDLLNDPKRDGMTLLDPLQPPGKAGENLDPTAANNQDAFIDIDGDGIRDVVDETQVVAGDQWGSSVPNRDPLSTNQGGLSFDISIINTDIEAQNAVENYMVGWWSEVGIEGIPTIVSESRQLTVTYDCAASFYTWGWGGDVDPDFLLSVMTTNQILYWQDAWYSDPLYDEYYLLQQTQVDLAERQATVWEMQRILYRDAPYLILWYDQTLTVVRSDTFTGWGDWNAHPGLGLTGYGNDLVMLTVRAAGSASNNCPAKPVIGGTSPITTFVGQDQAFVAESSDPDADGLTWAWDWGDGTTSLSQTAGASGTVTVSTSHAWTATGTYTVDLTVDDGVCPVDADPFEVIVVEPPAETGWINGTVTDAVTGESIRDAVVSTSPTRYADTTDADGNYSIALPVGTYSVMATASFYAPATQADAVVTSDATTTVDFELEPQRGWIVGVVTNSAGGPLPGVAIVVSGDHPYSGQTDSSGLYNISALPGSYNVTASLTGYVSKNRTGIAVTHAAVTIVDFVLDPVPVPAAGLSPLAAVGIGLGVLVIVIALTAWAIVRTRRRKEQIEAPIPPPKPPTGP